MNKRKRMADRKHRRKVQRTKQRGRAQREGVPA